MEKNENEIQRWYEEFHMESNGTDRMNKRQFQIYYTKLRKPPKLEQITDHIFRAFDTDHSGKYLLVSSLLFDRFSFRYGRFYRISSSIYRDKYGYQSSEIRICIRSIDMNENERIEKREAEKMLRIFVSLKTSVTSV